MNTSNNTMQTNENTKINPYLYQQVIISVKDNRGSNSHGYTSYDYDCACAFANSVEIEADGNWTLFPEDRNYEFQKNQAISEAEAAIEEYKALDRPGHDLLFREIIDLKLDEGELDF